jgi:hypothetical protein
MVKISATQIVIYFAGVVITLLLLGMIGSNYNSKNNGDIEYFDIPDVSSAEDVSGGASSYYGWGYHPKRKTLKSPEPEREVEVEYVGDRRHRRRKCPHCENIYVDRVDFITPATENVCRNCDITLNKDIDKYVLKSSIPPCPDMSRYALKSQLPPAGFNPDEWIRKSEIPPCPVCPDLRDYVKKSEIPACESARDCPQCPECPKCPTCPPCKEKTKVVEKVVYRRGKDDVLPQNLGQTYPQSGSVWTPKLSDSNSGFISPDVPMAGNAFMSRRAQELAFFR